ncbi:MAG: peptidoglycan-binding domain-containing protein [Bacillota bacterium]
MPVVYVFNPDTRINERYYRGLLEPMPYSIGRTMTVGEFRGSSRSNILWTDKRLIASWNAFRTGWGRPIFIGYAFKRIWEGGHSAQSQHYAGTALDLGHTLSGTERDALRNYAVESGVWSYVEPASITPRWVHVDDRFGEPACPRGGYPALGVGSRGVYVFILQDALTALGFTGSGLDGYYGYGTQRMVASYQAAQGLPVTGFTDCSTWQRLTSQVVGIGPTPTVVQ